MGSNNANFGYYYSQIHQSWTSSSALWCENLLYGNSQIQIVVSYLQILEVLRETTNLMLFTPASLMNFTISWSFRVTKTGQCQFFLEKRRSAAHHYIKKWKKGKNPYNTPQASQKASTHTHTNSRQLTQNSPKLSDP